VAERGVHPIATGGFGSSADAYERGRPGWPREAVALLARELGLDQRSVVVDLAAGTGKLTRLLTEHARRIIAVEPLGEMRTLLHELVPGAEAVEGTAEALPLDGGSVDAVFVGEAFHWFDGERALAEIARVLRPGGGLALLWNRPCWSDAGCLGALDRLLAGYRSPTIGDEHRYRSGRWRQAFGHTDDFASLSESRHSHEQRLDGDSLLAYVASISYIASLPEAEQHAALDEAARLIAIHEDPLTRGELLLPYCTDMYWTRRR
jgi:SAM-dependent methyltransferase